MKSNNNFQVKQSLFKTYLTKSSCQEMSTGFNTKSKDGKFNNKLASANKRQTSDNKSFSWLLYLNYKI